ncbi:unnamed protein product [Heligmosomoides polygyrus]|uniref:Ionotropic receptor n=1 Tax=Heligmosomoides polygyrus TaxID=6339 RepID=A0A183FW04_HELPZ|nr:unnamed protein product [Heligmosomoides polygyrus]
MAVICIFWKSSAPLPFGSEAEFALPLMNVAVESSLCISWVSKEKTTLFFSENISVVNVFMRSVAYERHEQQKQLQTADLLSNIAGSMGLFLGMSTVTLLEIFIYLFKSVWGTVNNERQRQFMDAMMEEENERRQSLVILEEPLRKVILLVTQKPYSSLMWSA